MADVEIEVRADGPYLIKGAVDLRDADGNPIATKKNVIALCRCGGSTTKPFCDGTHSKIGFQGAINAVGQAEEGEG
jgi:3-phenylpropionate/trans-cinnamate dioxygenase ferredoxin subunit